MYEMKSLFHPLKLRFQEQWTTLFHSRFLHGSFLVPTWLLSHMAASKGVSVHCNAKNYHNIILFPHFTGKLW
jgi:hypothetical protein